MSGCRWDRGILFTRREWIEGRGERWREGVVQVAKVVDEYIGKVRTYWISEVHALVLR